MLSSKSKSSGLAEALNQKTPPTASKVSKLNRAGSTKSVRESPSQQQQQNARIPLDKLPASADSKSAGPMNPKPRITPRISTPPDKQSRPLKPSELQAQLNAVQDDLKKAKERTAAIEKEKIRVLEDLKNAIKIADEANEKLEQALAAQKEAEEAAEIEKFHAVELETAGIEVAKRKEEEWSRKLETTQKQLSAETEALSSRTKELEIAKDELAKIIADKNSATSRADEVSKIAEANAKKAEALAGEVSHLKSLLRSELEKKSKEAAEIIKKLESETTVLKAEIKKAKASEEKLIVLEKSVQGLKIEVENAKKAESEMHRLVDEWKTKAQLLEVKFGEADRSNKSKEDTLADMVKKLEYSSAHLQDKESEISNLRDKIEILDREVVRYKEEVDESTRLLDEAKKEVHEFRTTVEDLQLKLQMLEDAKNEAVNNATKASLKFENLEEDRKKLLEEMDKQKAEFSESSQLLEEARKEAAELGMTIEALNSKIHTLEEAKEEAINNEKITSSKVGSLLEEKDKLLRELETNKEEGEKAKKAMEDLASALHEVTSQVREAQDEVAAKQTQFELAQSQVKELESELKNTKEKYEVMLDEVNYEAVCLRKTIEKLEEEAKISKNERHSRELDLASAVKKSEEEVGAIKLEMEKLLEVIKGKDREIQAAKEDGVQLQNKLKQVESTITEANLTAEEAKTECLRLNERLLDKENELKSITHENDEMQSREAAALAKIDKLSMLLAEATAKKAEENGSVNSTEKSSTEKDNTEKPSSLQKLMCSPTEQVVGREAERPTEKVEECHKEDNKNLEAENGKGKAEEDEPIVAVTESSKIAENHLAKEREHDAESSDEEQESNVDDSIFNHADGLNPEDVENGSTSPLNHQNPQKKKKPLLKKFGSILKKRGHFK
ncbi:WEB family protein At5g16730, chloroplastic-like [Ananas comosus]|uniref:WEB family protein At5g16730, chloroplastic-like n=1 Tax=Ananas comosus TaxID=4615 RepID=A0A6P5FK72_ANACO|nr:WEB family protein At5g16730, chloroplastic-like [Ananas comosus]